MKVKSDAVYSILFQNIMFKIGQLMLMIIWNLWINYCL